MGYDFEVKLPDNWEQRWAEVEQAAKGLGISVSRDGNSIDVRGVSPLGTVAAHIDISGTMASVEISEKPAFIPKSLIESKIREVLEQLDE